MGTSGIRLVADGQGFGGTARDSPSLHPAAGRRGSWSDRPGFRFTPSRLRPLIPFRWFGSGTADRA